MPDTSSPSAPTSAPPPFPTPESLRAAHADLLRRRRFNDDASESVKEQFLEEVRTFIERGRSTGVLLESDEERSNAQTLLNYWSNALCHAGQSVTDALLAEFDDSQAPELEDGLCPYRSLDTDVQVNSGIFHGWKRLIQDCLDKLGENCLVAVVGATGSGRSSLVRDGLLPSLKE